MKKAAVPSEVAGQISRACEVIERHLAPVLHAMHLYGSALDGGLRPLSDIDLIVTLRARLDDRIRPRLMRDLLAISAPPGGHLVLRPLEVTIVARDEVVPWRHPARRELQFGEWLREDIQSGFVDRTMTDVDLAILLKKARESSVALMGPAAEEVFDPVPETHFLEALGETLKLWNSPEDWRGDERNILLTLARIWYSSETGRISSKDAAASWMLDRLPPEHRTILHEARQAYLTGSKESMADRDEDVGAFIGFAKNAITIALSERERRL